MDFSCLPIVNLPLIDSTILNYTIFLSVVIYFMTHYDIQNMIIKLALQHTKVSNKKNNFVNFFKEGNTIYTLSDSTIFNISNGLNNFISKFLGQPKFFKYWSNSTN